MIDADGNDKITYLNKFKHLKIIYKKQLIFF